MLEIEDVGEEIEKMAGGQWVWAMEGNRLNFEVENPALTLQSSWVHWLSLRFCKSDSQFGR